jgi:hypothetical protein
LRRMKFRLSARLESGRHGILWVGLTSS